MCPVSICFNIGTNKKRKKYFLSFSVDLISLSLCSSTFFFACAFYVLRDLDHNGLLGFRFFLFLVPPLSTVFRHYRSTCLMMLFVFSFKVEEGGKKMTLPPFFFFLHRFFHSSSCNKIKPYDTLQTKKDKKKKITEVNVIHVKITRHPSLTRFPDKEVFFVFSCQTHIFHRISIFSLSLHTKREFMTLLRARHHQYHAPHCQI